MSRFDDWSEQAARGVAHRASRRSILTWLGRAAVGAAVLPVLPFERAAAHSTPPKVNPAILTGTVDTECNYWRYCSLDGFLCTCCGGTVSSCPPGTTPSAISWVGTCRNPEDGRDYLISYNDCCGSGSCGRCMCNTNYGELPGYRPTVHNGLNWCMADEDQEVFNCTLAVIAGVAEA